MIGSSETRDQTAGINFFLIFAFGLKADQNSTHLIKLFDLQAALILCPSCEKFQKEDDVTLNHNIFRTKTK